ncbi:MAG: glycosyltransferase family 2 protein [Pirellulales bacterium]|nr:glycosyltransferase family 2 protein [Pirellulales bacterium]
MDISIVIATWNNSARVRKTINAILACDMPDSFDGLEIVVVDNNSTDDTATVLREFESDPRVVPVFEPKQGLSEARNAGIQAAMGRLVLFADDDITPRPQWIRTYWDAFRFMEKPCFFGGALESEFEGKPLADEFLKYAPASITGIDFGPKDRELGEKEEFLAANWAVPMADLRSTGGFDETLGLKANAMGAAGEETALQQQLRERGLSAMYLADAWVAHFVPKRKTSLRHIGERWEMYGAYVGRKISIDYSGPRIGIYPRYLVRQYCSELVKSLAWRFLSKRRSCRAYLEARLRRGIMRAFRDPEH